MCSLSWRSTADLKASAAAAAAGSCPGRFDALLHAQSTQLKIPQFSLVCYVLYVLSQLSNKRGALLIDF